MQKITSFFLFLGVLVGLSACGPRYETTTSYVAPKTEAGMMCLNGCLAEKSACERDCEWQLRDCQDKAERNADTDYREYVKERKALGRELKKDRSDFVRSCYGEETCKKNCMEPHNLCYSNCGGQVMKQTRCVADCDQQ